MRKEERLDKIMGLVGLKNNVTLEELSVLLKVSPDTVRRDVRELSEHGMLKAVRGGAMQNLPLPYTDRQDVGIEEKKIIASKVQQFIKPNMVLFIDAGTTTKSAAMEIPKNMPLTVVTNSFPVATVLVNHPLVVLHFLGGAMNKQAFSTNGHDTIEAIKNIQAHVCLMGICSINLQKGVTGFDYEDTLVKKAMIANAQFKVALSTYDKVGTVDPYFICGVDALNVFVTEKDPSPADSGDFRDAGVKLI